MAHEMVLERVVQIDVKHGSAFEASVSLGMAVGGPD
jgi:hypothetical protein